jgi:hypothetical protein
VAVSFIGEETVIPGEKCHKMKRIHSFDEGDQESRIVTEILLKVALDTITLTL